MALNRSFSQNKNGMSGAAGKMLSSRLSTEVATRQNVSPWLSVYDALPNPDPVLRKTSSRIEILHEIKREPHVSACSKSRKAGVLKRLWKIEQGNATSESTELIAKLFQDLSIRKVMREMLDGWGYGYKPLEVLWRREGNLHLPFRVSGKPPEWFVFDENNELRIRSKNGISSNETEPYKFLLAQYESSYSNPYGEAQYSLAFWPTIFKKGGIKQWAMFLESFGQPHAIGKVPRNADNKEKAQLLEALSNLVQNAVATIPDDAAVELLEVKAGSATSDLYSTHAHYHDGEISKVILGHGAAADSTPGRLGNENSAMDVRSDIIDDDAFMVMECFDDLIRYIFEVNKTLGPYRPSFVLYEEEDVDTARADRDFKLMNSGRVILTKGYFTKRYDFDDDDIIVIETVPTSKPSQPVEFAAPEAATAQEQVDRMIDAVPAEKEQELVTDLVTPVIDMISNATSYEEVNSKLLSLYPSLDTRQITDLLEKGMLLASVAGSQATERTV